MFQHSIDHQYQILDLMESSNNETLDPCIHLFLLHMHNKLNLSSLDQKQLAQGYLGIFLLVNHWKLLRKYSYNKILLIFIVLIILDIFAG